MITHVVKVQTLHFLHESLVAEANVA